MRAARNAIAAMSVRGLDISGHRSVDVEDLDITQFDLVVALSPEVGRRVSKLNPKRLEILNVSDPYSGDLAAYRTAAAAIDAGLARLNL